MPFACVRQKCELLMKTILKPRKLPATAGTLVASGKGLVVGEDSAKASAASEPEIQITGGHQSVTEQLFRYQVDVVQRSILFMDVLRQRADNMLSHEAAGMPPLLDFAHEVVLDARQFAVPVNYALLRILPAKEEIGRAHV